MTYDPEKRERAFRERGLAFEDAELVFDGPTLEVEDTRQDGFVALTVKQLARLC